MRLPRVIWFERDEDPQAPVDWRSAALITATLFLTFSFYGFGQYIRPAGPLPLRVCSDATVSLAIAGVFFLLPAMAAQAAKRPILQLAEDSLGIVLAWGLRICCAAFLAVWISQIIAVVLWALTRRPPYMDMSPTARCSIAAGLTAFLLVTGVQGARTTARLALFTNKLAIAVLVAALIRVNEGWAAIPGGGRSSLPEPLSVISSVGFYAAPLGFLAAGLGARIKTRKQLAFTAFGGFAAPLFLALVLGGSVAVATWSSRFYTPSVSPSVGMALWARASENAGLGGHLIAAITTFGAMRFGTRAFAASWPANWSGTLRWALAGCFVAAVAALSVRPLAEGISVALDFTTACITVAGAVVAADFVSGRKPAAPATWIDFRGGIAMAAGLAMPLCIPLLLGERWQPWLLLSYGVTFFACWALRTGWRRRSKP